MLIAYRLGVGVASLMCCFVLFLFVESAKSKEKVHSLVTGHK